MEFENQYLTHSEYVGLGGNLEQSPFNVLEFKARQFVDTYTFGRLKELVTQNQEVKMCIYELINVIESHNSDKVVSGISSESTDGYSISYSSPSSEVNKAINGEITNIIRMYLSDCKLDDGTAYLYCGADK